jgi:transposase
LDVFAAIDWGGTHHQLAVVDLTGRERCNQRFSHDRAGLASLLATLDEHGVRALALERSEGLLVDTLQAHGLTIYPVSPRVSARARERYQAAARKSDRFDAFVLADTLRQEGWRWRPLAVPSELLAEIRAVVRYRRQTKESQLVAEAQLTAALQAYHPAVIALFSSVDRDATLAFLQDYPTPQSAGRVGEARMAGFCRRIGYSGRVPPEQLVERLRAHLLSASPGSVAGYAYAALGHAERLASLNGQLKTCNKHIGQLFERHPDAEVFASFPATGTVIRAELLAEIGEDRGRFPEPAVLLAEAGLAPVTLASGKVQRVRIRRACNRRLRAACTSWAYVLKRIDPTSRQRYLAALDRGQLKHRALRSIGASWTRVLWRCWQDSTPYDPNRRRTTG